MPDFDQQLTYLTELKTDFERRGNTGWIFNGAAATVDLHLNEMSPNTISPTLERAIADWGLVEVYNGQVVRTPAEIQQGWERTVSHLSEPPRIGPILPANTTVLPMEGRARTWHGRRSTM